MASEQSVSDFFYTSTDGLQLHARVYGEANTDHWPVVCLPGLTRNARDFHKLALYLSTQSAYDPEVKNYNVGVEAGDVLAGLVALNIEEAAFIGTSRGGLIIHVLGMMRPAVLKAIIFNDIGPVIEVAGLAHIQSYLEHDPTPKTRAQATAAQRGVHGKDFSALTNADWDRMVWALYRETDGGLMPDFDPKLVDTVASLDLTQPLPALWLQFEALAVIPLLAIRGTNSRLLSAGTLEQMQKRHPGIESITVAGQGHAPFLETGSLPDNIAAFLDRAERRNNLK
jgi:pimeloyl-ACP methyl ester carboxylesterase